MSKEPVTTYCFLNRTDASDADDTGGSGAAVTTATATDEDDGLVTSAIKAGMPTATGTEVGTGGDRAGGDTDTGATTEVGARATATGDNPDSTCRFVAATVLAVLTYCVLRVIVDVVLDRLGGVYVMNLAPIVDMLLFQNPMVTGSPTWVTALTGFFAINATMDAAFTSSLNGWNFVGAAGYFSSGLLAGIFVFHRVTVVK